MTQRGTIALDIDGTITDKNHLIPDRVAAYFKTLFLEGWSFIFVTGRSFSFAHLALAKLKFPFLLAVQNGTDFFQMPEEKHLNSIYLKTDIIPALEKIYKKEEEDFLIYSGFELGDMCYYCPNNFSEPLKGYLDQLKKLSRKPWVELEHFSQHTFSKFPLIKCFGEKEKMDRIEAKLKDFKDIFMTIIKDPINPTFFLLLITHKEANKGDAVLKLLQIGKCLRPLIVGGDDNNDIQLLKVGDIKIAMEGGPKALLDLADIIAEPSHHCGIIPALKQAIEKV